jgi:cytidyltransferase-like protein
LIFRNKEGQDMNKIGIMGGTFNPIHNGHLFLAENAREYAGLDKVLFMPSKNPPHKELMSRVSEQERTDMIRLAIGDNPYFEFSDFELQREGYTYTADTLTLLHQEPILCSRCKTGCGRRRFFSIVRCLRPEGSMWRRIKSLSISTILRISFMQISNMLRCL